MGSEHQFSRVRRTELGPDFTNGIPDIRT